jgi:CIC family chloride channel protein
MSPLSSMLTLLLKARLYLRRIFRLSESHSIFIWAAVAGVAGALATLAFRECIALAEVALAGHSGSLVEMARSLPWYVRLSLPALGGLVAGAVLVWADRFASKDPSDYMEAVAIGDGRIPVRHTLMRSISSLCTIASGGSIGREGSMVQLRRYAPPASAVLRASIHRACGCWLRAAPRPGSPRPTTHRWRAPFS